MYYSSNFHFLLVPFLFNSHLIQLQTEREKIAEDIARKREENERLAEMANQRKIAEQEKYEALVRVREEEEKRLEAIAEQKIKEDLERKEILFSVRQAEEDAARKREEQARLDEQAAEQRRIEKLREENEKVSEALMPIIV